MNHYSFIKHCKDHCDEKQSSPSQNSDSFYIAIQTVMRIPLCLLVCKAIEECFIFLFFSHRDFKLSVVHVGLKTVNPDPCGDSISERLLNNSKKVWQSTGRLHWTELTLPSIENIPQVWGNIPQSECVLSPWCSIFLQNSVCLCAFHGCACFAQFICLNLSLCDCHSSEPEVQEFAAQLWVVIDFAVLGAYIL